MDILKIQILTKIFEVLIVYCVLSSILSLRILNCLLLDLTVIDLLPIAHTDNIWFEIAKKFEMQTSMGRQVVSDFGHPWTRGEGGSKKGKFLLTFFMDGPSGKLNP